MQQVGFFGIGAIELLILGALVIVPLAIIVILIVILSVRRGSQSRHFKMPRQCPSCQTSFEPGSASCPQCGYSLDRP